MDALDRTLISELSTDARISVAHLARKLGVARSTIQTRIEKLEENGTIARYTIQLGDTSNIGKISTTVLVDVEPNALPDILKALEKIAEVKRIHTTSGRFDLMLWVIVDTPPNLDAVIDKIAAITGVRRSESLIHLSTKLDRAT
ncbi:Lrp/AsnC ligand binding domain-containing protein [Halocynthiibacter sp. C4]|uniref:Lrp/AsnC family transcriptional regulator n=1 Tax=Halocynthiibacter sp. C4 TaxID=2992758 RepID=UPI00237A2E09|nr:Lrp/AsnC ligand binding domain-containing protein [Halocynthiibacter sp. C4]MDE0588971.1 Lrp/AsnC ligand binding domain-containing protein [Halocynthiibacter sp. C4]